METFQNIVDDRLWMHQESAAITSTQDGSVSGTAKTHDTGPGILAFGTVLVINVVSADDADGDETYSVDFMGQTDGGTWRVFATFPIPRGTANQTFQGPITNQWWDGVPADNLKVALNLGGTTPSLDATVRIATPAL